MRPNLKITIGGGMLLLASYVTAVDCIPQQDLYEGVSYRENKHKNRADERGTVNERGGEEQGSAFAAGYAMMTKLDREGWQYLGWSDGVLPEAEWPREVKKLMPLRVYRAGPDVVIMMSCDDQIERGFYYVMPPSSVGPQSVDGWQFLSTGSALWTYTRSLDG